jgi:site-specific DNA-adenine methylase
VIIEGLGIPYMGSKRKLAPKIMDHILERNPKTKYIYDLFGGGGAVSFYAVQHPKIKKVYYNELNTGIVSLLEKIKLDGVTDEFYEWVSRDDFESKKKGDGWRNGLIKSCWSFGNNQKCYIYGKNLEAYKKLFHNFKVNKQYELRAELEKYRNNLQDDNVRLEHLERLQHLENLQHLQYLQYLQVSNMSYENVNIVTPIGETVIYLDPPYFNTGEYQEKICHDKLLDYINNSPYKIYVSSYEFDLPCVKEFTHRSTLSATVNNKTVERLFCNKTEQKTLMEELLGL